MDFPSQNLILRLLVDFPSTFLLAVQQTFQSTSTMRPIKWDRHMPSPWSCAKAPRLLLRGYLPQDGLTMLEARLCLKELQKLLIHLPC